MEQQLSNLLARLRQIPVPGNLSPTKSLNLQAACRDIENALNTLQDPHVVKERLNLQLCDALIHLSEAGIFRSPEPELSTSADTAPVPAKLPPEILEWARQQFSEQEYLDGIRNIEETGGLELRDFIRELEQAAHVDE